MLCLQQGVDSRCKRHQKNVSKCVALLRKQTTPSSLTYTAIRHFLCSQTMFMLETPCVLSTKAREIISSTLARSIQHYFVMNPKLWMGNNDAAIATMLYLLSEGWTTQGVTVVERVPHLKRCLPRTQDVGLVSKLSCRSMSTGTRAFKKYALNENGMPIFSKCFKLSDKDRSILNNAFFM